MAPFVLGLVFSVLIPERYVPSTSSFGFVLFVGTAFFVTALPVLGRIIKELGLSRSRVGVVAPSAGPP